MDWIEPEPRADLQARARTALAFADTPLVRLRHAAPVGHGFGVPSPEEVLEAWERSRTALDKNPVGAAATKDDGFPLPGLPSLFGAVAGTPLAPATLLEGVSRHVVSLIEQ
jgi:hypothetical protein